MNRADLSVYNEATGFMITSKGLCAQDFSEVDSEDEAWPEAVEDGIFLPFELVQDDSFIIRVVLDEPLNVAGTGRVGRSHSPQAPRARRQV